MQLELVNWLSEDEDLVRTVKAWPLPHLCTHVHACIYMCVYVHDENLVCTVKARPLSHLYVRARAGVRGTFGVGVRLL